MSTTNPFRSAFEMQRTMIDQSRRAVETGVDVQRTAVETWMDSAESTKSMQKSGLTVSQSAVEAYLDGLKSMVPEESVAELEAAVDEQFAAVDEIHEDAWHSFVEGLDETEVTYDEMTEMQLDLLAESFDALEQLQADAEEMAEEAAVSAEELTETA
jgi:hypothetical protein